MLLWLRLEQERHQKLPLPLAFRLLQQQRHHVRNHLQMPHQHQIYFLQTVQCFHLQLAQLHLYNYLCSNNIQFGMHSTSALDQYLKNIHQHHGNPFLLCNYVERQSNLFWSVLLLLHFPLLLYAIGQAYLRISFLHPLHICLPQPHQRNNQIELCSVRIIVPLMPQQHLVLFL